MRHTVSGSRAGAMMRVLAPHGHKCGEGSIDSQTRRHMWVEFVDFFLLREDFLHALRFSSLLRKTRLNV